MTRQIVRSVSSKTRSVRHMGVTSPTAPLRHADGIGLGTGVVKALAKQLDAQVVTLSGALGTKVSVTHATFAAT